MHAMMSIIQSTKICFDIFLFLFMYLFILLPNRNVNYTGKERSDLEISLLLSTKSPLVWIWFSLAHIKTALDNEMDTFV